MVTSELSHKLAALPLRPGCYLFKDAAGQVIYVGKAVSLRHRVRSYFQRSANLTIKLRRLVDAVRDLDTIVVGSELEALVLECNLIKKHQPHYNVRLRDDKQYPYLCITTTEPFPRLLLTRRVRSDRNKYFGPYSGSRAVYNTMDLMKRLFPIVSCGKQFDGRPVQKPCLYYHMGQCLAPCAGLADRDEYQRAVQDIVAFLEGKPEKVVRDLRCQMGEAAEELQFERAARLRDQIQAVEEVMARQKVISSQMIDQDVIAVVGAGSRIQAAGGRRQEAVEGAACVQMFYIRGGKLIGQNSYLLEGTDEEETASTAVQEFVKQYYQSAAYVPQEILLPCDIDEAQIVQSWLRQKRGGKVEITVPVRGDKKRLIQMAAENAAQAMEQMKAEMRAKLGNAERALQDLSDELGLESPPARIECYDISHSGADHFVGSMVVFTDGMVDKSQYRRFKIKFHENRPDDFAMMREIISRRLHEAKSGNSKFSRLPDLLLVDGGKGQLASAVAAIRETGFTIQGQSEFKQESGEQPYTLHPTPYTFSVAALAKRFEHLYLPGEPDPVILPRNSQALFLVQRIRDEAHRFANAYRVTLQSKKQVRSALDLIPGIGPTRRKALLKHFGSIDKMRTASIEQLCAAPKMTRPSAETVYTYLQSSD